MVVAPGPVAIVVRVDACAERRGAKDERQRASEPGHVCYFLAVSPFRPVCPLSIAPALRLVRMNCGIRGQEGSRCGSAAFVMFRQFGEMSGPQPRDSSAGSIWFGDGQQAPRPSRYGRCAWWRSLPQHCSSKGCPRGQVRQFGPSMEASGPSRIAVAAPCSSSCSRMSGGLGRGVALLPWLPYPRRMDLAAIGNPSLDSSYLLMTRHWRNAAQEVERLDEGSDQRQALHGNISSCFKYVCSMHINKVNVKTAWRRRPRLYASDHAFAAMTLRNGNDAHQSQVRCPRAITASTMRVKLARARPTVCRARR